MLKIRIPLLLIMVVCFFAACKNDPPYDKEAQLAIDDAIIVKFIADNKIPNMKKTSEGLYYQVIEQGTGTPGIALTDTVIARYVGRLLSGVLFDSTAVATTDLIPKFLLSDVIEGWRIGIPMIQPGGRIRLIVPSPLAYQNNEVGNIIDSLRAQPIPANSILDFDIKLISIIKPDPTNPGNPTNPGTPANPGIPTDPIDPTDPTNPIDIINSTNSTE